MKDVATILFGSNNYGLDTPDSDKDYKVLLIPSFDDLYCGKTVEQRDLPAKYSNTDNTTYCVMDARKFVSRAAVGNINVLEMLFSTEISTDYLFMRTYLQWWRDLYKNQYLVVCWPTFIASTKGLIMNSLERNGISTKTISRAYYMTKFVEHVINSNFVVTYDSWRENDFVSRARMLRFSLDYSWAPTADSILKTFEMLDKEGSERAEKIKAASPLLISSLTGRAQDLQNYMKNFVREEM